MSAQKWFKFYGQEYLSDPKIERLTPVERSCWLTILCMASTTDGVIRFLTIEALLNRSGVHFDPYRPDEWENALGILKKFETLEMIACQENGDITVTNWDKRQETNLTGAERVRKHRLLKTFDTDVTTDVTNVTLDKNRIDKNRIEYTSDFDAFWLAYPKRIGKTAAYKAWGKAKLPALDVVLLAVEKQKKSKQWQADQGQYIPHPATWLNQGRWDDELEEALPDVLVL